MHKTVEEVFNSIYKDRGGSIKFTMYLEVYEECFLPIKNKKLKILEIGIERGGSLSLWEEYFDFAEIYAVDIDPRCKSNERENIHIFTGDQADEVFMTEVAETAGNFDIIIDDGGHFSEHHKKSFDVLFPYLNDDGLYIVEDLHTAYYEAFNGGYKKDNFVDFCKKLCDFPTYNGPVENDEASKYRNKIKEIKFYNSLVVIRKGYHNLNKVVTPDFNNIPF
jgi:spermidine synthase